VTSATTVTCLTAVPLPRSADGQPTGSRLAGTGATFEWTQDGALLFQHVRAEALSTPTSAADGTAITGAWESSADGVRRARDFAVSYAKLA
jgi:hypothetical protein